MDTCCCSGAFCLQLAHLLLLHWARNFSFQHTPRCRACNQIFHDLDNT